MASLCLTPLPPPPPSQPRKLPIVVNGNPPTFVSAPGRRIVAVGDLHGDLDQARCALEMAGVLSPDGQDLWTGGETVNGNHETMNVEGDFRYVESEAFDECIDFLEYLDECGNDWEEAFVGWIGQRQKGVIARSMLLRPGGPLACELAQHAVALKVNDWVFCHGGLLPHHVAYGMERLNREVSHWMRGLSESSDSPQIPFIATRGYDSVVWNRLFSRDVSDLEDYQIEQASLFQ
uniref:Calcineurin-like phosphoesterase domain-containing protein n=1 Tax=Fagus sylvatica TaxID=28930 RepID=A0A2N9FHI6_FAGSY